MSSSVATQNSSVRRIAIFGSTQGCGLASLVTMIKRNSPEGSPIEVHALVRNEQKVIDALSREGIDADALINAPVNATTRLVIFKGDAMEKASIQSFFQSVINNGPLNNVISSIGAYPVVKWYKPFAPVQFAPGMEDICSKTMQFIVDALEQVVAPQQPDGKVPALIVVASNGIGKSTHDALPMLLKPMYGNFLKYPHMDKEKMERFLHTSYGIQSSDFNPIPSAEKSKEHPALVKERLIVVRPSLLTSGAAKSSVRSSAKTLPSAYTVSRKDVGNFIAGDCLHLTDRVSETPVEGGNGYVVSY
ncbi:uncharacterized protein FA14DRAFT_31848 [Meira miltonrushii]|uniref:NAD(P)-binding domain-containing protein n=1 Tax=Meira miltonrushii TaxID=1280837 RepID=A0A316VAU6_9BASI|nr:uncharacterized protein FA14DRAFT_31848 [Meira miltonrushii]PWN34580.1 hypothetical protein FA14DRAFT_31848 [Meira miltonrushii]